MHGRVSRTLVLGAVVVAVGVIAATAASVRASAASTGTLDQGNAVLGQRADAISSCFKHAQTFTAGNTGALDRVDIVVTRASNFSSPLNIGIHAVLGGVPTGAALGTASVAAAAVPINGNFISTWEFVSIPLTTPVQVTTGVQYAIVLSSEVEPSTGYSWADGTPYPAGTGFTSSCFNGGAWAPSGGDYDPSFVYAFRTYVAPIAPPPTVEFLSPIDGSSDPLNPIINQGRAGRVIPIKVRISLNGALLTDANTPGPVTINIGGPSECTNTSTSSVDSYADAGSSNAGTAEFRYDAVLQAWVYNLDTKNVVVSPSTAPGLIVGHCYRIDVAVAGNEVVNAFAIYQPSK